MNSFGIFTAPMVKELMFHSITNHQFDANFTEKAIKSLVKRLRQSKELGCIEKLRKAITTKVNVQIRDPTTIRSELVQDFLFGPSLIQEFQFRVVLDSWINRFGSVEFWLKIQLNLLRISFRVKTQSVLKSHDHWMVECKFSIEKHCHTYFTVKSGAGQISEVNMN